MREQALPYDIFLEALRENEVDALKAYPVLVVCGDTECTERMAQAARRRGLDAICCCSVVDAGALLPHRRFSLLFSSDVLPDGDVASVIGAAGGIPVVVFSRRAEWDAYLEALGQGAFDYITCPPDRGETERVLALALKEAAR